ncbi:ubiquinol oxidase subunit II [Alicyclobacillus curvatus]|jgi:cytochrome aa3-600 menaquinol oxidase subunit II|nr:ubiquinol oxidase subunit II [Alicyclobacillus curvatus]
MKRHSASRTVTVAGLALTMMLMLTGCGSQYVVLNPAGPVGNEELHLIVLSAILVGIVIVPVLILLAIIVYRYRDKPGNKALYQPNFKESRILEVIWWGIPIIIIGVLGAFTAKTTFALTKPPENNIKPMTVEVTSMDWKWLFQYPGQGVATVNYVNIPVGVPVQFVLTADSPMNSFWIPQLGGQEYTMPGMAMGLWLQADKPGTYAGYGANFTGSGFAHMHFQVHSQSQQDFTAWVNQVKQSNHPLTMSGFDQLSKPGLSSDQTYSSYPPQLFSSIVKKFSGKSMPGMNMTTTQTGSQSGK